MPSYAVLVVVCIQVVWCSAVRSAVLPRYRSVSANTAACRASCPAPSSTCAPRSDSCSAFVSVPAQRFFQEKSQLHKIPPFSFPFPLSFPCLLPPFLLPLLLSAPPFPFHFLFFSLSSPLALSFSSPSLPFPLPFLSLPLAFSALTLGRTVCSIGACLAAPPPPPRVISAG